MASPVAAMQISPFHPPAAESCMNGLGSVSPRGREGHEIRTEASMVTYMSKYTIERASSPIDSSASMMVLSCVNNRRTGEPVGVGPSPGRDRVVVGVSGRFDAHGVLGVGECSRTCRSIPAVAITGSTGWMSVLLTIDRWP